MADLVSGPGDPVTAADIGLAVRLSLSAMRAAADGDWHVRAGSLEWDCWETAEHMGDNMLAYSAQLGPVDPPLRDPVPFLCEPRRPGGPASAIYADPGAGVAGLLQIFEATGAIMVAMVAAAPASQDPPRPFGVADPACFAAAAVVAEVLVHTHDVAAGLGFDWTPPAALCSRVLTRMFPGTPADSDPWATLLWSTGRDELPGLPAVTSWTWHAGPRD